MSHLTKNLLKGLLNIWLPKQCFVCGDALVDGEEQICTSCMKKLPATGFQNYNANPVERRFWGRVKIKNAFSGFYYRKEQTLQKLIHAFKYHSNKEMAIALGRELGRMMLNEKEKYTKYDYLVPVPLHPKKMKIRGYNQSQLIAQGINDVLGIPINNEILLRSQFSGTQTKRHKYERWKGVENNFAVGENYERWAGASVIIVDDVLTTGATIESCCQALEKIPELQIGVATIGVASD